MSRIEWDKAGEKFYETGVDRGVLYPQNSDGTYAQGVGWNGLTSVNQSPSGGDANDLYADNTRCRKNKLTKKPFQSSEGLFALC